MKLHRLLVLACACSWALGASAQWQWIDKDGRKVFSDRPPRPTCPRITSSSSRGRPAAAPRAGGQCRSRRARHTGIRRGRAAAAGLRPGTAAAQGAGRGRRGRPQEGRRGTPGQGPCRELPARAPAAGHAVVGPAREPGECPG
ncbi:DUF4124 domain-containing protein [Paracidovorax citrulli]|uniref:DUF4124 domain-containing protein n=1 Tax=Paracidovorax citrulli TaxID=80869 RepID=UPI0012FE7255